MKDERWDKMVVMGVDPGREKCGIAVIDTEKLLWKSICDTADLAELCRQKAEQYQISVVVMGNGTSSKQAMNRLQEIVQAPPIVLVDEYRTTDAAKTRYWKENPPRGLKRFIPEGMRVLPVPVDDYAAWILAERYLAAQEQKEPK